MVTISTSGRHQVLATIFSTPYYSDIDSLLVPGDQPDLVIDAIRQVVEAVRDPSTWATPQATPSV